MAKHISVLIKPASSLCNLRCRYCFYHDVSENRTIASTGIMKEEVMEKLIARISEELEEGGLASISFQGGEPTMAGLPYFRTFTETVKGYPNIRPQYSIQTNATLLDEEWADFFKENDFLVGVSLDGYQTNMDEFRYEPLKRGVFYKVLKGIDLLKDAKVDYNILTVVTAQLAKHPDALFKFFKSHNFEYIQLIPCLPGLNEKTMRWHSHLNSMHPSSRASTKPGMKTSSRQASHSMSISLKTLQPCWKDIRHISAECWDAALSSSS